MISNSDDLTKAIFSLGVVGTAGLFSDEEAAVIYQRTNLLQLKCLGVIPFQLPEIGRDSIAVAANYWGKSREVSEDDLYKARNDCRLYLESISAFIEPKEKEHFAIKAVICVLCPEFDKGHYHWLGIKVFSEYLYSALEKVGPNFFEESITEVVKLFFE